MVFSAVTIFQTIPELTLADRKLMWEAAKVHKEAEQKALEAEGFRRKKAE